MPDTGPSLATLQAWLKLASCLWVDCVAMMPGAVSSSPVSPMAKRRW